MRIAHVTDGYLPRLGGIETQVHDLAQAQFDAGHDVEIITTTPAARTDSLVVHRPSGDRTASGRATTTGTDRALAGHYDVLHVHLSIASPLAASVLWRASKDGRPVVATMHSLWGPAEPALAGVRRLLGDRACSVTWTAVSTAAAIPLRRSLDVPVTVVPNGVDVAWWAEGGQRTTGTRLRALSVMRLTRRKRPMPLVRLLHTAERTHPAGRPVSLTLVGDGRQSSRLAREAGRRGLVTLTGRLTRDDIRGLMGGHDVYIAPAPLESFGLAALEARSAGLPVLAYRRSGVADFVRDGFDGVLVSDDHELAATVAELARQPELLRRLQRNARLHRPDLGWDVTLTGYEGQYVSAGARRTIPLVPRRDVVPG